jgi:hypothetical protein
MGAVLAICDLRFAICDLPESRVRAIKNRQSKIRGILLVQKEDHFMSASTLETILSPEEYSDLRILAEEEGKPMEQLLREAVQRLLHRRRPLDLTRDPSFGLWKDNPRSDEELLADLGGNWQGVFPEHGSTV